MSGEGGDTGGGEAGTSGKGSGGFDGSGADFSPGSGAWDPVSGTSAGPSYDPGPAVSPALGYTSPGEQAGFQGSGDLPNEITTGSSGGSGGSWFGGDGGGFNLAGSGPVGGDSGMPGAGGGTNTPFSMGTFSSDAGAPTIDTSSVGAPTGGGVSAFVAPAGVGGSPQLDSLVSTPAGGTGGAAPAGGGIFDSLLDAEKAATDQYGAAMAPSIPSEGSGGSTTLPAVSTPSGAGGGGGGGNSGSNPLGNISANPLGIGAAAVGLLNNMVNGNKPLANATALSSNAGTANAVAEQQNKAGVALQQYVATGKLPDSYESQVQQAANAAKTTIISNYANRGLPTDPSMNSTLAQELAQVDARLPMMREQIAADLAKTGAGMVSAGLTATGISSGVYQTLANLENDQNKQRGAAIANFASALSGGTRGGSGLTVNLGSKAA